MFFRVFKFLINLTRAYGAGNPLLLGTYQGRNYPEDATLNYETNVEAVVKEQYAKYFDDNGNLPPKYEKYISLQRDGIKAKYRMHEWIKTDPASFFLSYLILKPFKMANDIFYWERVFNIPGSFVYSLQYFDMLLCIISAILLLFASKYRQELFFLVLLYWGNVYLYSIAFAFGRYNISLMPVRFILIGIGLSTIPHLAKKILLKGKH